MDVQLWTTNAIAQLFSRHAVNQPPPEAAAAAAAAAAATRHIPMMHGNRKCMGCAL